MVSDLTALQPIHVGFTNCFPIDTGDGLVLIDTGLDTDQNWERLTRGLEERGRSIKDVRWVLLTHAHTDHCGLVHRVKDASNAQIIIHQLEAFFLRQGSHHRSGNQERFNRLFLEHGVPERLVSWLFRMGSRSWGRRWEADPPLFGPEPEHTLSWEALEGAEVAEEARQQPDAGHAMPASRRDERSPNVWRFQGIEPDVTFDDNQHIELADLRLRSYFTPGHTPGHACFYHEESRVFFSGDHILKRITPNPGLYFVYNRYERRSKSLPDYIRSLMAVRNVPCVRVLGGHESEMPNMEYAVDRIVMHHERRARTAMSAVRHGKNTTFALLPVLFPTLRSSGLFPALGETLGHLDLLEEQGQVAAEMASGCYVYHPLGD